MIAVLRCRPIFHETEPGDMQLLHAIEKFAGNRPGWRFEERPHPRQHGSIDHIGLGIAADGFSKAPCLSWVHLGQ